MDTRVDVMAMFGLAPGDVHVIRNAGGLATEDAIRSLSVSQRLLHTDEVIVIMHEGCGLQGASDEDFADALAADGAAPSWRLGGFDDVEVALSRELGAFAARSELRARDKISGFIFEPATGVLRPCDHGNSASARSSPADR